MNGIVAPFDMVVVVTCATVLTFAGMAWVAVHDMRSFEIDPDALLAATLSALSVMTAIEGPAGVHDSLASGTIAGVTAWYVARLLPGRIGRGDVWLFTAMATVSGTALLPLLFSFFFPFAVLTSAAYSISRGKRLFRSMIPAALPGMAAAAVALVWRVGDATADASEPIHGPNAISALLLLFAIAVAGRASLWRTGGAAS